MKIGTVFIGKVIRVGKSKGVLIPMKELQEMKADLGDEVFIMALNLNKKN